MKLFYYYDNEVSEGNGAEHHNRYYPHIIIERLAYWFYLSRESALVQAVVDTDRAAASSISMIIAHFDSKFSTNQEYGGVHAFVQYLLWLAAFKTFVCVRFPHG